MARIDVSKSRLARIGLVGGQPPPPAFMPV
jgi:hypothetical protein